MRRGRRRDAGWGRWCVTVTTSSCSAPPRNGPKEARRLAADDSGTSGCACIPTRPGSSVSDKGQEGFDFLGFHHRMVRVVEIPGPLLLAEVAVGPGHGLHQGQGASTNPTGLRRLATCAVVVEELNPVLRGGGRTSATETRRGSSTPSTATSTSGWPSWPASSTDSGPELGHPVQLQVAHRPRGLPADRNGALLGCACLTVNDVGEPCAGEPHARFDRGPLGRRRPWRARNTHPTGNPRD